jgi:hypothetical protein
MGVSPSENLVNGQGRLTESSPDIPKLSNEFP